MMLSGWQIAAICGLTALVTALVAHIATRRRDINRVSYIMDALEDGELNFRFTENNRLNRTLNRIRTIFDKQRSAHEQDSWSKLIRVLTHEIMNTISPIASLSDALASSVDEHGRSPLDLKAGLETIAGSSKDLIKFVETYRELSGVARPTRRTVELQHLMDRVLALTNEQVTARNSRCHYVPQNNGIKIYADEGQISQVLINLIKNALQAEATRIDITARQEANGDVLIDVSNNGAPIPTNVKEQIFVPFYTTKREGSGIGLSISRQIMRNHNGSLELLRSDNESTVFVLRFG